MSHSSLNRHHAVSRDTIGRHVAMLCASLVILASCNENGVGPEKPLAYSITKGACGEVVFAERIGVDSISAIMVIETRKSEQYGEGKVKLDPFSLEVVDNHGNAPEPDFYALRVLDATTGGLLHSVSEVITTDGDLFKLWWCPD